MPSVSSYNDSFSNNIDNYASGSCIPNVDQPMQPDEPKFKNAEIQCELLVTSCECGIKSDGTVHSYQRKKSTSMSFKDIYKRKLMQRINVAGYP